MALCIRSLTLVAGFIDFLSGGVPTREGSRPYEKQCKNKPFQYLKQQPFFCLFKLVPCKLKKSSRNGGVSRQINPKPETEQQ